MLSFSHEDIILEYRDKKNLIGTIEIKNQSVSNIYFKFKVNRPKFYLVKPDRGIILPSQSKKIQFTLHRDGLSQIVNDKFKCYYTSISQGLDGQPSNGFEEQPSTNKQKLNVKITNLPSGINVTSYNSDPKGSELKSLGVASSQYHSALKATKNSSTLQGIIKQKQDRISTLRKQITSLQTDKKINIPNFNQKKKQSILPMIGVGVIGLVLGVISSYWI